MNPSQKRRGILCPIYLKFPLVWVVILKLMQPRLDTALIELLERSKLSVLEPLDIPVHEHKR